MNQATLKLPEYQGTKCGRLFYINALDRRDLDLDFGCPYGCDDNGRHIGDIRTEVKGVTERGE